MSTQRKSARKRTSSEREAEEVSKRHITVEESTLLMQFVEKHKGRWAKIMKEEEVIAMGYSEEKLKNHVKYVRKQKNAKKGKKGTQHREKVLKGIEDVLIAGQEVDDHPVSPESSEDEELQPLSKKEKIIDELDGEEMKEAVSSKSFSSAASVTEYLKEEKEKRQIRNSRIQEKATQSRLIVDSIHQQQRNAAEQGDMRNMMQMYMLKMMDNVLHGAKEEDKLASKVEHLSNQISELITLMIQQNK